MNQWNEPNFVIGSITVVLSIVVVYLIARSKNRWLGVWSRGSSESLAKSVLDALDIWLDHAVILARLSAMPPSTTADRDVHTTERTFRSSKAEHSEMLKIEPFVLDRLEKLSELSAETERLSIAKLQFLSLCEDLLDLAVRFRSHDSRGEKTTWPFCGASKQYDQDIAIELIHKSVNELKESVNQLKSK